MIRRVRRTRLLALVIAGLLLLTALVVIHATRDTLVQPVDDWVRTQTNARQTAWLVDVAKALSIVGAGWWAIGTRVVIAGALVVIRRWRGLVVFVSAAISTSVATAVLKSWIDRPRPPGGLVHAADAAYPSGHASAAAAIAVGAYLAFAPGRRRGRGRGRGIVLATTWIAAMSASRLVLDVHWCSDVIGGVLLGWFVALGWTSVVPVDGAGWGVRENAMNPRTPMVPITGPAAHPSSRRGESPRSSVERGRGRRGR